MTKFVDRLILGALLGLIVALVWVAAADAHYRPGSHNAIHAISLTWCGKGPLVSDGRNGLVPRCGHGYNAMRVARCEASARYWSHRPQDASNGQYQGMFQMGSWERRTFGHGPDVWAQAQAAHRYWRLSGWHPWECAHILGII